jgi:hypothetical protein
VDRNRDDERDDNDDGDHEERRGSGIETSRSDAQPIERSQVESTAAAVVHPRYRVRVGLVWRGGSMSRASASSGDTVPEGAHVIEVRVAELRQLFNAIDPSPFRQRDLDPRAEAFIVEWATDLPRQGPLALRVHLERAAGRTDEAAMLGAAIHQYFDDRMASSRRRLRELFSRGRISLVIALAFLGVSTAVGDAVAGYLEGNRFAEVLREGFVIGGWVAMWRPLEVFLYDWWPIRAEARLFSRLSTMPVTIEYGAGGPNDSWRSDWPAAAAQRLHLQLREQDPEQHARRVQQRVRDHEGDQPSQP